MMMRPRVGWGLGCLLAALVGLATVEAQARLNTYEQLTVAASAVGIATATLAQPAGGQPLAFCTARLETAEIRFRLDGTAPTSTVGTLLEVGDVLLLSRIEDARVIRFIRTGGTSGVLDIHCGPQP